MALITSCVQFDFWLSSVTRLLLSQRLAIIVLSVWLLAFQQQQECIVSPKKWKRHAKKSFSYRREINLLDQICYIFLWKWIVSYTQWSLTRIGKSNMTNEALNFYQNLSNISQNWCNKGQKGFQAIHSSCWLHLQYSASSWFLSCPKKILRGPDL